MEKTILKNALLRNAEKVLSKNVDSLLEMSTFLPADKGQTIRMPSTANLMVDSADRPNPSTTRAYDFQITRPQALLNGFFTRVATSEVVLDWNTPNLNSSANNNWISIDASGVASGSSSLLFSTNGFYTAAQIVNWLATQLDKATTGFGPEPTWTVAAATGAENHQAGGGAIITPSAYSYAKFSGPIADMLGISGGPFVLYGPSVDTDTQFLVPSVGVDLRCFRYLDFVSAQLTYNQDLKDSSTAAITRDVLCRWYMSADDSPALDEYGYPILMGYTPFSTRRIFSPPKQIKWDNIQPVGNLSFQVYSDQGSLAPLNAKTNFLMTLQISEV